MKPGSERAPRSASRRYASVVTTNPGGTGSPAFAVFPRLRPFPPTRAASASVIASKNRMFGMSLRFLLLQDVSLFENGPELFPHGLNRRRGDTLRGPRVRRRPKDCQRIVAHRGIGDGCGGSRR